MGKQLFLRYKENFATTELIDANEVTTRFAELDPFLDGFFLGLARVGTFGLLNPVVKSIQHEVRHDKELSITRITIKIEVIMEMVAQQEYSRLQTYFNDAMNAFLGTRFPNIVEGKDAR